MTELKTVKTAATKTTAPDLFARRASAFPLHYDATVTRIAKAAKTKLPARVVELRCSPERPTGPVKLTLRPLWTVVLAMMKQRIASVSIAALLSLSLCAACGTVEEDIGANASADTEVPDTTADGQTDVEQPDVEQDTEIQTDVERPDVGQDAEIQTDVERPDVAEDGGPGPDAAPGDCTEPSPRGCADEGCPEGLACVLSADAACAPSSCSCDAENDVWICTEDCGPTYLCAPVEEGECPAEPPIGESCEGLTPGIECSWGAESCCGATYASTECSCMGGSWACLATDACFIRSCEGRACNENTDCDGGGEDTFCRAGTCVAANSCLDIDSESTCNTDSACRWQIAGCGDDALGDLPTGCYPAVDCALGECPTGTTCRPNTTVLPECARDPDFGCDACGMSINVCVPAVAP